MAATAALFHHPDVVESDDTPLAGRRTAGQSFLEGYVRHVDADVLHCVAANTAHIDHFRALVTSFGWSGAVEGSLSRTPKALAQPGAVMLPGPTIGKHAWPRRRIGQRVYSLCGITHTVSTRRIMEGLFDMLSAPVEDWDAIICTSTAVQRVVANELDAGESYLRRRFAARRVPRPQLPVIPLGINADVFTRSDAARTRWRTQYNVPDDGIVVMSMGRLSVFEKMQPAPLLLALERAARVSGKPVTLLMVGWFGDKTTQELHESAARALAPSVAVHFPDGRDKDLRYSIWSAADIFALPVDNIQETFGLAPIEAMAAGLPVVCSDWNGFRDTVDHGTTGFRVRTLMSRPGYGRAVAERFEDGVDNYFQYLSSVHQRTAVDVREMAEAFTALIASPDLRAGMGQAGRARVEQLYDWSAVVPQYQALWADLNARRRRGIPTTPREGAEPANPAAIDPFELYRGYPTDALPDIAVLRAGRAMTVDEIETLLRLTGAHHLRRMVTTAANLADITAAVHRHGPIRVDDLARQVQVSPAVLDAGVLWLAKFDLLEITT